MDIPNLLRQAASCHQSGNLAEAGRLYAELLRAQPDNFTARQLLALLCFQEGRDREALEEITIHPVVSLRSLEFLKHWSLPQHQSSRIHP